MYEDGICYPQNIVYILCRSRSNLVDKTVLWSHSILVHHGERAFRYATPKRGQVDITFLNGQSLVPPLWAGRTFNKGQYFIGHLSCENITVINSYLAPKKGIGVFDMYCFEWGCMLFDISYFGWDCMPVQTFVILIKSRYPLWNVISKHCVIQVQPTLVASSLDHFPFEQLRNRGLSHFQLLYIVWTCVYIYKLGCVISCECIPMSEDWFVFYCFEWKSTTVSLWGFVTYGCTLKYIPGDEASCKLSLFELTPQLNQVL